MSTETTTKIERVKFPTWVLNDKNYWQRPLTSERAKQHGVTPQRHDRIIINAACGSDFSYDRLYVEAGYVFAMTLGLAASFDATGTSDPITKP